jgi:hypothetical protein
MYSSSSEYQVKVKVLGLGGRPLTKCRVFLQNSRDGILYHSDYCEGAIYGFKDIKPGTFDLITSSEGYTRITESVEVGKDKVDKEVQLLQDRDTKVRIGSSRVNYIDHPNKVGIICSLQSADDLSALGAALKLPKLTDASSF